MTTSLDRGSFGRSAEMQICNGGDPGRVRPDKAQGMCSSCLDVSADSGRYGIAVGTSQAWRWLGMGEMRSCCLHSAWEPRVRIVDPSEGFSRERAKGILISDDVRLGRVHRSGGLSREQAKGIEISDDVGLGRTSLVSID
ncbi:hypothetical protein BJV78DRAFT_1242477 [Lactifluus subvellereus]|nr:hypothetical protein BJV78DRAFT_1242477 [Lactifluus subvellereus]